MNGYILIDKPAGWTSFDVVNKIRFMLAERMQVSPKRLRVGHSGTLDPAATGLLIILIGAYTKRQAEFMKLDKVYWAEITLGAVSNTDDGEDEIKPVAGAKRPTKAAVLAALKRQMGVLQQMPPQFSALKLKGKKAYELARAGETAELKPRTVTVRAISDVEYQWPRLAFRAEVSSGTYIRSIARDLGQDLGTGGYLSRLRRETIGQFSVSQAVAVERLSTNNIDQHVV